MNKSDLLKQINDNDVYKDDMAIIAYNSKGELTENVKVVTAYGMGETRLAIVGEDD